MTRSQIHSRLGTGDWLRVHPGVYRVSTAIPTAESSLRAAALWVGERGILTGTGAAWWWELLADPPPVWQFATPPEFTLVSRSGVQIARCFVDPADRSARHGVPVTDRALTVLRTAIELERRGPGNGIALIDRAKQKGWVTQAQLQATHERHRGTWGSRSMGLLLSRTGDRAHSVLERHGVRELRAAGITEFVLNYRTVLASGRAVELDVAFPELAVALEFDGYAFHSSAEQHRSDLQRANEIMASGWLLRRFTWSDVLSDPDGFIRTVRAALEEHGAIR